MSQLVPLAGTAALALLLAAPAQASPTTPGCEGLAPAACLGRALEAMGGAARLAAIHSVRLDLIGHTALTEQSYRQAPYITAYERDQTTIDLGGGRLRTEAHQIWPESDLGQAESDNVLIATATQGVYHAEHDTPCSRADLGATAQTLALGPLRLLLTAQAARDLHYEASLTVRESPHTVLAFTWNSIPVRLALNPFNQLPDLIETRQRFDDFWYYWGTVTQRVYWDNWRYVGGISYPSNEVIERNGIAWRSSQALDVRFDVPTPERDFAMDPAAAARSAASPGWERPFNASHDTELARGVDLYQGPWNTTIVHQDDGVVILETPISAPFTRGIFAEAARRYPGEKVRAVLMTSDSWPHVGGLPFDAGAGAPLYVLDMNVPLMKRLLAAQPHSAGAHPQLRVVSAPLRLGAGENRMELIPLRGEATERQYLVYFPAHRLLYASDTLVLNADHSLYDPELMHEVRLAVERQHLEVDTVYAMHQGPTPWKDVIGLLDRAAAGSPPA